MNMWNFDTICGIGNWRSFSFIKSRDIFLHLEFLNSTFRNLINLIIYFFNKEPLFAVFTQKFLLYWRDFCPSRGKKCENSNVFIWIFWVSPKNVLKKKKKFKHRSFMNKQENLSHRFSNTSELRLQSLLQKRHFILHLLRGLSCNFHLTFPLIFC